MSKLTLYNVPPSLCSQKVRLALVEKGVEFSNHWVDIGPTSENYQPWYVRLNPKCVVPTLTHGDEVVRDSSVIMRYAAEKLQGAELIPSEPAAREQMETWYALADHLDFRLLTFAHGPAALTGKMLQGKLKKLKRYAEKYPDLREQYEAKLVDIQGLSDERADPVRVAEERQKLEKALDEMDVLLAGQTFLAGEQYSLADVIWTVVLTRLEFVKLTSLIESRPHVWAYYASMKERPSYKKADLWPRFHVMSMMPVFAKVLGPRLAVLCVGLSGLVMLLQWWM